MPIEIRELVIRAVVDGSGTSAPSEGHGEEDQSKLIQKCVDEVLKALRRKRER